jgi:hypothetical protein
MQKEISHVIKRIKPNSIIVVNMAMKMKFAKITLGSFTQLIPRLTD